MIQTKTYYFNENTRFNVMDSTSTIHALSIRSRQQLWTEWSQFDLCSFI